MESQIEMKLKQKRYWVEREFNLTDTHVQTKYKDLRKTNEFEIHYKSIKGGKERILEGDYVMYLVFRICWLISVLTIIGVKFFDWITYKQTLLFFMIGFFALVIYYFSRKDYLKIRLSNNQALYIFRNKPDCESVDKFVTELINKRDIYLRRNYLNFDRLMSYEDQRQNLKLLFEYNVINQSEFDANEKRLRKLFNNEEKPDNYQIGFR